MPLQSSANIRKKMENEKILEDMTFQLKAYGYASMRYFGFFGPKSEPSRHYSKKILILFLLTYNLKVHKHEIFLNFFTLNQILICPW